MQTDRHDIIAAPATAPGGALAIIRLSGEGCVALVDRIFRGRRPLTEAAGHTLHYGRIVDGDRTIDDVTAAVFRTSYTGEEAVEITCHGSRYIVAEIQALCLRHGARTAEPGEFTARAFLAGRIDLSQAEAVADLIAADSRAAHALASNQMRGGYSDALGALRNRLLHLSSLLELELDFSEEEVEFADRAELRRTMEEIGTALSKLIGSFTLGNAIKEGVAVAIVGAPNVGKSTLLNRLLGEERAMVSEIAGTTRDVIEETVNIDGILFRFIDTAGLRETDDRLERMGIERTYDSIRRARIVMQLIDATRPDEAVAPALQPDQTLLRVINKIDLPHPAVAAGAEGISVSAKAGIGIDELRANLRRTVDTEALYRGDTIISNSRHLEALHAAYEALRRALEVLRESGSTDLLSEEIRQVSYHLGTITGQITTDEILGTIFSKFCIGK